MTDEKVDLYLLTEDEDLLPIYASKQAAGADLRAALKKERVLAPGESMLVPTGLFVEVPKGYEAQIRPRSGLALKHQITVLNTPGTIDSDYRGEVGVILINHGKEDFVITPKMRIAQMIITPVTRAKFIRRNILSSTERGQGGFGHSGME